VISVTLRISDAQPAPEPTPPGPQAIGPRGSFSGTPASAQGKQLQNAEDSADLSPVSRLAAQAIEGDPQRVEVLRLQFQAGQYTPDAYKTSEKMVEEHLDNPD
jgi:anti-sigma28 factor (negative regulator of flagellin synthesis)